MNKDIKTSVVFDEATSRLSLDSGDSVPRLFCKVKKWLSDLQAVAFSGKYSDLTGAPSSLPADGGNADTAAKLTTARYLTIGNTGKPFDGSANVGWSLADIGAASVSHTHAYNDITSKPPVPTLSIGTRTQIPANVDLNDYTTAGSYFISSGATAATIANYPPSKSGGFFDVWYNNANLIRQEFKSWAGIPVYRWYSDGTWSDWSAGYLPLTGGTLTGTLNIKQTLYMTDEDGYSNGVLRAYSSGTSYGNELVITGSGNVFIGGGESAINLRADLGQSSAENTYISADGTIFVYTNCQTIANKLLAMSIVANGTVTIPKTLNLTSTADAIGKSYNSPALVIGASTGEHLEIDNNEIMAKADAETVKVLTLNQDGGEVYIGAGAATAGTTSGLRVWGNGIFTGTVTAPTFSGALSGNAATATTATKANTLTTARTINGTSFNGSANITTANWGTARTLTIGSTGKSVNGSANVAWTLAEIGAAAASHTHSAATASAAGFMSASDKAKLSTLNFTYSAGTTTTPGGDYIKLGNATASGTAGNKHGELWLYDDSTHYACIRPLSTNFTGDNVYYIPNGGGTFLTTASYPTIPVSKGGTGATTAAGALNNLLGVKSTYATNSNSNCCYGYNAGAALTGSYNVAVGINAMQYGGASTYNTAIGVSAMGSTSANSTHKDNVAVGSNAMAAITTGNGNTGVGAVALYSLTTGTNNTGLGYYALSNLTAYTNCTGVGYNSQATGNNQVVLGSTGTTVYGYSAYNNRSDLRDKTEIEDSNLGLEFIKKLRPVSFKWDLRDDYKERITTETPKSESEIAAELKQLKAENPEADEAELLERIEKVKEVTEVIEHEKDGSKKRTRPHYGMIAQEVKTAMDELGVDFAGYQDHSVNGGEDVLTLGYTEFIAPMVKAIQELAQQNQELLKRIEILEGQK